MVINHAWLGEQIEQHLDDHVHKTLQIQFSAEGKALETAGGIVKALPLLGTEPFALLSADIFSDFDYKRFHTIGQQLTNMSRHAWCVMIPNPAHHQGGDFACINGQLRLLDNQDYSTQSASNFTYSGLGLYHPRMFAGLPLQFEPLRTVLKRDAALGAIGAEIFDGIWEDVGTPERLAQLDLQLRNISLA